MERKNREQLKKSFQKSLLDTPVPLLSYSKKSKRIKALPPPLVPTKYVAPKPVPKPRTANRVDQCQLQEGQEMIDFLMQ